MKIINPATEEIIKEVQEDGKATLDEKFALLRKHQPRWAALPPGKRIEIIEQFSSLLDKNIEPLAQILTSEMGKPLQQSTSEIKGAQTRIKWLSENANKYLGEEVMQDLSGLQEKIAYEPLGVVCNISAWNYPYLVGVNVFVPALLAGNAVLYKPSEYTSLTGIQINALLKQAGVPENIFQIAIGGGPVGSLLLDMPFDGYFFTGSYKTGKYLYEKIAAKMVPCQCELGGKDPLYVASDVQDVQAVAASTADGAFYNNGQSCCAVERIYVHEKIYDAYVEAFVQEVKSWKIGAPSDKGVYIGPVTRMQQIHVLEDQIADALKKGAVIRTGGQRIKGKGYYFQPTVLEQVNHQMLVMQEESFGPVIGIMKVKTDQEAIDLMQDSSFGLTASVYSQSRERAENILQKINSGTVYWNCCDRVSAALPWSGRKNSGIGATLSYIGLRAFTKTKAYHLKTPQ
ncbi:MAG: aldehyde dehydrogenase family protein [Flavisolibacter sp.]